MRVLSVDPGLRNMSLCYMEDHAVLLWTSVDLLEGHVGKKAMSAEATIDSLVARFDPLMQALTQPDVVLVEKQPHTNAKMRVMEGALLTYFRCRLPSANVKTYSPRYKLKGQEDTKSYSARKILAVKLVKDMLSDGVIQVTTTDNDEFEHSKKKDDRADSMLMCLHHLGIGAPFA